ncbi:MAG: hypothetical protein VZR11_09155 [Succinimonas sp.]|nr:hypothetical protein [Succinimonas sp.]
MEIKPLFKPDDPGLSAPRKKESRWQYLIRKREEAEERLKQVKADIRRQEEPAGFFARMHYEKLNSRRIAEAEQDVCRAKSMIKMEEAAAELGWHLEYSDNDNLPF